MSDCVFLAYINELHLSISLSTAVLIHYNERYVIIQCVNGLQTQICLVLFHSCIEWREEEDRGKKSVMLILPSTESERLGYCWSEKTETVLSYTRMH